MCHLQLVSEGTYRDLYEAALERGFFSSASTLPQIATKRMQMKDATLLIEATSKDKIISDDFTNKGITKVSFVIFLLTLYVREIDLLVDSCMHVYILIYIIIIYIYIFEYNNFIFKNFPFCKNLIHLY